MKNVKRFKTMSLTLVVVLNFFLPTTYCEDKVKKDYGQLLAKIISSSDPNRKASIFIKNNRDKDVAGMYIIDDEETFVTPDDLKSKKGKVILKEKGISVLILKSNDFSVFTGGYVDLVYLHSYSLLSSNDYRKYNLEVVRGEGDLWELMNNGVKINTMTIVDGKWGIDKILFN